MLKVSEMCNGKRKHRGRNLLLVTTVSPIVSLVIAQCACVTLKRHLNDTHGNAFSTQVHTGSELLMAIVTITCNKHVGYHTHILRFN